MQAKISQKKKVELGKLIQLIQDYPIIGIADTTSLPSAQLQVIRKKLKSELYIRTTKKRLIKLAINNLKSKKEGIENLSNSLNNCMPALLLTKENPFKLVKLLSKNKSKALAKPGQISPKDLIIPAGPTPFGPGPIIGELGASGIKAAIEQGKVVIREDKLLVKKGELITQKASDMLVKFNIKPMEIGINVVAIYESGIIYQSEVLSIDEKEYLNNIRLAHQNAYHLALARNILTKETIKHKLAQAYRESIALANSKDIITDATVKNVLVKAEAQASALDSKIKNLEK